MKPNAFLLYFWLFAIAGSVYAYGLSYDYTAVVDCLEDPIKPQYNGGIIVNPEANDAIEGWTTHGDARIEARVSENGNNFLVAYNRKHPYASVSQKVFLEKQRIYTFSAWIQVNGRRENVPVTAIFKTVEGFKPAGSVIANAGCWSMLKGGITVDASGPAELYFQSNDTSIDIWIDSVSLQPFTEEEWQSHQYQSIEKARKANVRLQVLDAEGRPTSFANISLYQSKVGFPFGVAINKNILQNRAYQRWFIPRFTVTTFENEMKWYSTEKTRGKEDYSVADAMLRFTKRYGILVRGHNIVWDDPRYQVGWVYNLSPRDLRVATQRRINSVVPRYAGKVIAWDVNNENIHFNFFESKLGANITGSFFRRTRQLDRYARLFINDYNTIEDNRDEKCSPSKYLQKLREVRNAVGWKTSMGIGIEGHFDYRAPNIAYMRSAIDFLASARLPIWITELDVQPGPYQANYLEQILREAHAHPAIKGIVIWSAWSPQGCYRMCLTDNNFNNLPTGNVVDKLLREWGHQRTLMGTTDAHGFLNVSLFHGDYELKFNEQPTTSNLDEESSSSSSFISQRFTVDDRHFSQQNVVKIVTAKR